MISWQDIIAWVLLGVALVLAGRIIWRQFSHVEIDPKCMDCPVPDLKRKQVRRPG